MGYFCQISNYNTRRWWNSVIYEKSMSEITMVIRARDAVELQAWLGQCYPEVRTTVTSGKRPSQDPAYWQSLLGRVGQGWLDLIWDYYHSLLPVRPVPLCTHSCPTTCGLHRRYKVSCRRDSIHAALRRSPPMLGCDVLVMRSFWVFHLPVSNSHILPVSNLLVH